MNGQNMLSNVGLLLAAFFFSVPAANAAVIERDWKVAGDGLLTYDTLNHREWLDLTETQLFQFPGDTLGERYAAVIDEIEPGGLFEGFTPAAIDDVFALAESAGIDTSTTHFTTNQLAASALIDLLGPTSAFGENRLAAGVHLTDTQLVESAVFYLVSGLRGDKVAGIQTGPYYTDSSDGAWLFRTVPEPSSIVLAACMLLIVLLRSRRAA